MLWSLVTIFWLNEIWQETFAVQSKYGSKADKQYDQNSIIIALSLLLQKDIYRVSICRYFNDWIPNVFSKLCYAAGGRNKDTNKYY